MNDTERSIIIFDLDGTITRYDTYVRFLLYSIYQQPLKSLRLPMLAIDVLRHKIGRQSNTWLKKRFLSALLAGQHADKISSWAESFASHVATKGTHLDALERIKSHQENGHELVLLSASLDVYVEPLGKRLGFEQIICTRTTWQNNVLDSELDGGNCYGVEKINRFNEWLGRRTGDRVLLAYADHETDFPLLKIAERGIVVNPDRKLRAKANQHQLEHVEWK